MQPKALRLPIGVRGEVHAKHESPTPAGFGASRIFKKSTFARPRRLQRPRMAIGSHHPIQLSW